MHPTWNRRFGNIGTKAVVLNALVQATVRGIRSSTSNKMITSIGSVYIKHRWIGRRDSVVLNTVRLLLLDSVTNQATGVALVDEQ